MVCLKQLFTWQGEEEKKNHVLQQALLKIDYDIKKKTQLNTE